MSNNGGRVNSALPLYMLFISDFDKYLVLSPTDTYRYTTYSTERTHELEGHKTGLENQEIRLIKDRIIRVLFCTPYLHDVLDETGSRPADLTSTFPVEPSHEALQK